MIYKINMSKGDSIIIDEDDLIKIRENISANLIQVKGAIINPSFMISITPTQEKDTEKIPVFKVENGVARMTGTKEMKKVSDIMNNMKLLGK